MAEAEAWFLDYIRLKPEGGEHVRLSRDSGLRGKPQYWCGNAILSITVIAGYHLHRLPSNVLFPLLM